MNRLARPDALWVSAALTLLTAAVVAVFGWDKPFWYDEIHSLGAATLGPGPDWDALKRDVHPPTYPLLVWLVAQITGAADPAVRLVNLPAVLALGWGLWRCWTLLGRARGLLLVCLILCNLYFLQMLLDMRAYVWLLGFGFLGHSVLAEEVLEGRERPGLLILCAAVLTSLHYFGAAIGLALLGTSGLRALLQGRFRAVVKLAAAGVVLLALFLTWVLALSNTLDALGGGLWIRNGLGPWLDFIGWQAPLFALLLALPAFVRSLDMPLENLPAAGWLLLPGAVVLLAAVAISIHSPVVSVRNLIVLVPGLSIAAAIALPNGMMDRLTRFWPATALILVFCIRYGDTGLRGPQYIEWAITQATPPACAGAPLLYMDAGVVEDYAQGLFAGQNRRPFAELQAFDGRVDLPEGCNVIAAGWHQRGTRDEVRAFFEGHGVEVEVIPPPDARLAASPLRTSGYVVTLR